MTLTVTALLAFVGFVVFAVSDLPPDLLAVWAVFAGAAVCSGMALLAVFRWAGRL